MRTTLTLLKNKLLAAVLLIAAFSGVKTAHAQLVFEAGRTYYVNGVGNDLVAPKDTFVSLAGTGAVYTGGAYTSATGLFYALSVNGIDSNTLGTLTIYLVNGYTGLEVNPVVIRTVAYASPFRPIVMKPAPGLNFNIRNSTALPAQGAAMRFEGTQFFTLDGESGAGQRNIIIQASAGSAANTHRIVDFNATTLAPVSNITIKNVNLIGLAAVGSVPTFAGVYIGNANNTLAPVKRAENINILNCGIINAQNGVYARGISFTGPGPLTGLQDLGLVVKNCDIGSPNTYIGGAASMGGIHLINQANVVVENNVITNSLAPTGGQYSGILLGANAGTQSIDSNITINANRINNIRGGASAAGIRINLGAHTQDLAINITNNVISRVRSTSLPAGISIESSTANAGVNIINNSISLTGDTLIGTSSACISVASTVTGGVTLVNNILSNRMDKTVNSSNVYSVYGISLLGAANPFKLIDNNLYDISTPSGWAFIANKAGVPAVAYASLDEWRTFLPALSGKELGSLINKPIFNDDVNLATSNGAATIYGDKGRPMMGADINGNLRSTTSNSIGAYEFTQDTTQAFAPLQGNYTYQINGVNNFPKYSNVTVGSFRQVVDFVDYLNTYGTNGVGDINLVIAAGYSNDTLPIPAVAPYPGMSGVRKIYLTTAPGVSATITLASALGGNATSFYSIFRLNGTSFFNINGLGIGGSKNITFTVPSTLTNSNVNMVSWTPTVLSSVSFNSVSNCNILGNGSVLAPTTNSTNAGIYIAAPFALTTSALGGSNIENSIYNNFIGGVRYGIYWRAKTGVTDQRNRITMNKIGGASPSARIGGGAVGQAGMYFKGIADTDIDSNVISHNHASVSGYRGIDMDGVEGTNSQNVNITRNTIFNLGTTVTAGYAIGMRIRMTEPTRNILVANNLIAKIYGGSGAGFAAIHTNVAGIVVETGLPNGSVSLGVTLVHNTVHLSQTAVEVSVGGYTSAIHYGSAVNGIYSRNNIFSNTMGRVTAGARSSTYAISFTNSAKVFTGANDDNNANVYYAEGKNSNSYVGIVGPSNFLFSMGELRLQNNDPLKPLDGISFFGEVPFLNDTTTLFDARYVGHIADAVIRLTTAPLDIRGLPRNFTTAVGAFDVTKDFGSLHGGATYQVNGIMAPPTAASPLAGSFNTINNLFRYINTNGVEDANPPALPIYIEITNGYVGEGDTLITPLLEFPRMSNNRNIIIRPAAGATPVISSTAASVNSQFTGLNGVITFKGAQWVTIDGSNDGGATRSLTIKTPTLTAVNAVRVNNTLTRVVDLISWSKPIVGVTVKNCNILGASTDSTVFSFAGIYLGGANYSLTGTAWVNNFPTFNTTNPVPFYPLHPQPQQGVPQLNRGSYGNTFENNFIGAVRYGVYLLGKAGIAGEYDYNNKVVRNIIGGNTINLTGVTNGVPTNYFGGTNASAGITLISQAAALVDSNVISNNVYIGTNLNRGIEIVSFNGAANTDSAITVSRNIINNIRSQSYNLPAPVSATAAYGIYMNLNWNAKKSINVINNMISGIVAPGSANTTGANFQLHPYGILVEGGVTNTDMDLNFYHNSINMGAPLNLALAGSVSACLALNTQIRGEIRLVNNILQNRTNRTSGTGNIYSVFSGATVDPFLLTDFNNYYANGVNSTGRVAAINGATASPTFYTNINDWRTFTTTDTMSLSNNAAFTNDNDLRFPNGTASMLFRAGIRLQNVPTDLLNSSRPSMAIGVASMGAHEFIGSYADSITPLIYDYTPVPDFCLDFTPITIVAKVYDRNPVTYDTMYYSINGGAEVMLLPDVVSGFDRVYTIPGQPENTYIRYRFVSVDGSGKSGIFLNSDQNSGYSYTTTTINGYPLTQGFDLPNIGGWKVQKISGPASWNISSFGSLSSPALAPLTGVKAAILRAEATGASTSRLVSPCLSLVGLKRPTLRIYVSQNPEGSANDRLVVKVSPGFNFWTDPAQGYAIARVNTTFAVPGYKVYDVCLQDYEGFSGLKIGIEGTTAQWNASGTGGNNIIIDSVIIFDNFYNLPITPKNIVNCYNKNISIDVANAESKYEYSLYDMLTGKFISSPVVGNNATLTLSGYLATSDSAYLRVLVRNLTSNCTNLMDDTAIVHFRTFKNGPFVKQGANFIGSFNDGTLFNPDAVKIGSSADYEIVPPSGTTNSGYGTTWTVAGVTMPNSSGVGSTNNFSIIPATPGTPALVRVNGVPTDSNGLFILSVRLRILPQGCDSIVTRYVRIANAPDVDFFIPKDTFCQYFKIPMANFTSNGVFSFPVLYSWDFGDGTTATSVGPTKAYNNPGSYTIKLIARNNSTLMDSMTRTITILPSPTAGYTYTIACAGKNVSFINSSTSQAGITYNWNFGHATSLVKDPTIVLQGSDTTINVRLITTNIEGCSDTSTQPITIFAQPTALFTANNVCAGASVQFNNASTITPGKNGGVNIFGSEWQFGNGDTGFSNSPSYEYPQGGTYRATLKVISNFGCTDTVSRIVSVFNQPVANYTVDNTCRGSNLILNNTSTFADGLSRVKVKWDFGDNSQPSSVFNPVKTYGAVGQYDLKLVMLDTVNNCVDSLVTRVTVKPSARAEFSAVDGCVNTGIQFTNLSVVPPGVSPTFAWTFGDGSNIGTTPNPVHTYTTGGSKNVVFIVDVDGCRDTATKTLSISNARTVTYSKTPQADSVSYIFTATDPNFARFVWDFADGTIKTTTTPSITNLFPSKGWYKVRLTAIDANGCSAEFLDSVEVWKTVGVKNALEAKVGFNVYPNPFGNNTNVEFELNSNETVSVELFDMIGRKVFTQPAASMATGKHTIQINESNFDAKAGIYMVRLHIGNDVISRQIIKQ